MPSRMVSLFYVLSFVALGLSAWGVAQQKHLAVLPADIDPRQLTYPVRLNGIEAGSADQVRFLVQGYPAGSVISLGSAQAETAIRLARAIPLRLWIIVIVEGLLFWLVATLIFAPRAQDPAARDFMLCTLLYGLAVCVGGVYFTGSHLLPGGILVATQILCLALLPPLFLHLGLIFPRRSPWLEKYPWLPRIAFGLASVVIAWQFLTHANYFFRPGPASWRLAAPSLWLGDLLMVIEVTAGCALLLLSSFQSELERQKQQARWLVVGFFIGVTPYVFLRTLPSLWGASSVLTPELDRIFELAIPAAFVLAVVQHQLLDIDVIIRRGTIYAVLTASFVTLYLAVALSVGRVFTRTHPASATWIHIGVALLAVAIFNPLRSIIGRWVDRTFFKIRYDNSRALQRLRARLARISDPNDLALLLVEFVETTLAPRRLTVIFDTLLGGPVLETAELTANRSGRSGGQPLSRADLDGAATLTQVRRIAGRSSRPFAAPRQTSLPERERRDYPEALHHAGYVLVQPLAIDGDCHGALLLGPKDSERRYVELDLKLLQSAGRLAGRTLERLSLIQAAAREAFELQRFGELNRQKNEFLARVAHDLRTPLASIRWSADNLADGVLGPVSDLQMDYARAVKASADQLGRLIDNLMDLSRLDFGADRPALGPVNIAAVISEAAVSLKPLAGSRHIEIRTAISGRPPALRGNAVRLHEVVNNLLDNAIAFSPDNSTIDVSLEPDKPGWWRFAVRDHGPGLGGADPGRLFERYAQGAPRPHGRLPGYGLGLFVVRNYVEQFGGSVSAADHPEGGAVFCCRLPEWEISRKGSPT